MEGEKVIQQQPQLPKTSEGYVAAMLRLLTGMKGNVPAQLVGLCVVAVLVYLYFSRTPTHPQTPTIPQEVVTALQTDAAVNRTDHNAIKDKLDSLDNRLGRIEDRLMGKPVVAAKTEEEKG